MFARLADLSYARPKLVLAVAAAALITAGAYGADTANRLFAAAYDPDSGAESVRASNELTDALGHDSSSQLFVLARPTRMGRAPESRRDLRRITRRIEADPEVGHVEAVARRRTTLLLVYFRHPDEIKTTITTTRRLQGEVKDTASTDVQFGGYGPGTVTYTDTARDDLIRAELLTFPVLLILLLFVFRGVVAALLPLSIAGFSLLGSVAALKLLDQVTPVSIFALNVATALGIGLAIDYSLLLVSRYREELAADRSEHEALRATVGHAGRAVFYSGLTVAAAMSALTIFPQRLLYSMGFGGVFVALFAIVAALFIVPSLLALLGTRVNALSLRRKPPGDDRTGGWYRLSQFVMRRPAAIAVGCTVLLLGLGLPFLGAKFVGVYGAYLPDSNSVKQAELTRAREFPNLGRAVIDVDVRAPDTARGNAAVSKLRTDIGRLPDVAAVAAPQRLGPEIALIHVASKRSPYNERTPRLVGRIRSLPSAYPALVGGETAVFVDFKQSIADRLPIAFGLIVLTMMVVIFLMTGSVILPVKTIIMNALSLSAAFGILVLIFQDGRFEGLLDYRQAGGIDIAIAPFIFAAAFGLSTDYGLFLIARIREQHLRGMPDRDAIATGMQRTGKVITAAALLLCVALGALATSSIIFIKEAGVGLALAVAIDATIVRALLVPALMRLMGHWNWWAPAPLARLHRHLGLAEKG